MKVETVRTAVEVEVVVLIPKKGVTMEQRGRSFSAPTRRRPMALDTELRKNIELVNRILRTDNHYEVLGVEVRQVLFSRSDFFITQRDCSEKDLKAAFKKFTILLHPTDNAVPGAADAFNRVAEAFRALTDASSRSQHDDDTTATTLSTSISFSDCDTIVAESISIMQRWPEVSLRRESPTSLVVSGRFPEQVECVITELKTLELFLSGKSPRSSGPPRKKPPSPPPKSHLDPAPKLDEPPHRPIPPPPKSKLLSLLIFLKKMAKHVPENLLIKKFSRHCLQKKEYPRPKPSHRLPKSKKRISSEKSKRLSRF